MSKPVTKLTGAGLPKNRIVVYDDNVPLMGKVISWTVGSLELNRDTLGRLWGDAGLDIKYIPKEIRTRTQVLRTLEELEVKGFTRKIVESAEQTVWVLVDENIDTANQDVEFEKTDKMIYDKAAKTLKVSRSQFQPIVDQLMERFSLSFQSSDVRSMILDVVKDSGALTLRDKGGIYFVPCSRFEMVDRLQAFVGALNNGDCSLMVLPIPAVHAGKEQIFKSFEDEFLGDLERMAREIDELEASEKQGAVVRDATWIKRIGDFKKLKSKAEMFADLLELEAKKYIQKADAVELRVKANLLK